jgi:hypothetical protein
MRTRTLTSPCYVARPADLLDPGGPTPAAVRSVVYLVDMAVVDAENSEPNGLSLSELHDEIATLASHIYAGTCRRLELVAELDRRGS